MIPQKFIAIPVITASMALSTACLAKPSHNGQATVKSSATAQHNHAKISAPYRYLKPGASISYTHNLPIDIDPGQTVVFQLRLNESYNSGTMTVDIKSEGDLQLFPSSAFGSFDMSTGRVHVMDVSVTVGSSGRHYLKVQAMADNGSGQPMPRIFSIPVQSGPVKALKPHSKMITTSSGQNIIVMEAEEVIQ